MNRRTRIMALVFTLSLLLMGFYPELLRQASQTYDPGRIFYHVIIIQPLLYVSGAYLAMEFILYRAVLSCSRLRTVIYRVLGPGAGCLYLLAAVFLTVTQIFGLFGDFTSYLYWGLQILTIHKTIFIIIGVCLCLWNHK